MNDHFRYVRLFLREDWLSIGTTEVVFSIGLPLAYLVDFAFRSPVPSLIDTQIKVTAVNMSVICSAVERSTT